MKAVVMRSWGSTPIDMSTVQNQVLFLINNRWRAALSVYIELEPGLQLCIGWSHVSMGHTKLAIIHHGGTVWEQHLSNDYARRLFSGPVVMPEGLNPYRAQIAWVQAGN